MAEMIPESIADSTHASMAEKDVFAFLRDVLVPDEEYLVWFEPRLGRKTPDFVIYAKLFGLLVLEVKGYHADKLIRLSPKKFTVRKDGREETEDSPLEQAEKSYRDLMDRIKLRRELCHSDGPHQGKPMIPVGYCAALPSISHSTADQRNITSVVTPTQCLFSEDFEGDANDRSVQRRFLSKIRPIFAQRVQFRFDGLDNLQELALRTALSPEVQLGASRENDIAALDLAQERIAKSIGAGHRILKGVVGSGKSVVVAARAKYLARCNPGWKILVLCYNVSLVSSLRTLVSTNCSTEDKKRIDVLHYHGLVKKVANVSLVRDTNVSFEDWEAELANELKRTLTKDHKRPYYDAILIDEGQDFDEEMVQAVAKLLRPEFNSLLFCYDPAQNVFGRKAPVWKQIGILVQGKRPTLLTKCYRSTSEIVSLATRFMGFETPKNDEYETPLFPQVSERHGKGPYLKKLGNEEELTCHILDGVEYYVRKAGYDWGDIGVLYAGWMDGFPMRFQRQFIARFHIEDSDKLYWVSQDSETKHEFNAQSSTVKMCTIESSKGLEFKVVFLVGVDQMPRANRKQDVERKLVYVGLTRAQEVLHVPYCTENEFIRKLL